MTTAPSMPSPMNLLSKIDTFFWHSRCMQHSLWCNVYGSSVFLQRCMYVLKIQYIASIMVFLMYRYLLSQSLLATEIAKLMFKVGGFFLLSNVRECRTAM